MKNFLWSILLVYSLTAPAWSAELSSDDLVNAIYNSNVVDKRIPLAVTLDKHQATVSMFVNRDSQTFENDSKIAALKIAKSLLDSDPSLTSAVVQFKSQRFTDYIEIAVGGGDVTAYSAGRKTKDEIARGLEVATVPISGEQLQKDAKSAAAAKDAISASDDNGSSIAADSGQAGGTADSKVATVTGQPLALASPTADKPPEKAAGTLPSLAPPVTAKDKLFKYGRIAFYYPANWLQRPVSRNDWATPDELGLAEFACSTRTGQPFVNLARFTRIGLQQRLRTEAELGTAFDLEVTPPERVRVGYGGGINAVCVISSGREGRLYFKRVYFNCGPELYAITLRCKSVEAALMDRDFKRILGTLHSPRK